MRRSVGTSLRGIEVHDPLRAWLLSSFASAAIQIWPAATAARALFAYAARKGCRVRSVDLVAAYLQGKFVDGEVVYCYQPAGYPELDSTGQPMIARVEKPCDARLPSVRERRSRRAHLPCE